MKANHAAPDLPTRGPQEIHRNSPNQSRQEIE
jgi:hypothetical protein